MSKPAGKSLAQARADSTQTWADVLPSSTDIKNFFTPNFKLAIACCGLSLVAVLSVSLEYLKPAYFTGGDWYWMLALSCACTAASRASFGGTMTTDHLPAFKKDKQGSQVSYICSAILAAWMAGSAAFIVMNTSTCENVQLPGCDYMCTRCLEFDPPCREPNELAMSIYSHYGLKKGAKVSVQLVDPAWNMAVHPTVSFDLRYYSLKYQKLEETVFEYDVGINSLRPRRWKKNDPKPKFYEIGDSVEWQESEFIWYPAKVYELKPVAGTANWNFTTRMLDVITGRREVTPDTEFGMTIGMGNSQSVKVPSSVSPVTPGDTDWMYSPLERPPTRSPTPFPTEESMKTPSPTPWTCRCDNTCKSGPNMDIDLGGNGFCEDGKDSVFLKNVSINDPMNLKYHRKVGEIAECWCSDTGGACYLTPSCKRSYKVNVAMKASGSIVLTEEYIVSNQQLEFNYDTWAYESKKLIFGAACAPGSDCEDCGPTIFDTVQPFKTCNDTTPAPTPFPFDRPLLGGYKLWSANNKFLESGDIDANSVKYTSNDHVCFDKFYIYWNYCWCSAVFITSMAMWRVSVYKYFSIKRKKFVMYPLDMDDWKMQVQVKNANPDGS